MESSWPSLRRGPGALSRCPPPRRCHRGPCPPVWAPRSVSCPRRGWRGEAHTRTSGGAACPPASGPASPWSLASSGLHWPHLASWVTGIIMITVSAHYTSALCEHQAPTDGP